MAYTAQNGIDFVRRFIKQIPLTGSSVDVYICDTVNSIIHNAYPWRWSLGALTPITLLADTQDYTISNADFWRPVRIRLARTDTTPDEFYDLDIVEWLAPELARKGSFSSIRQVSRDPQNLKLRLDKSFQLSSGVTGEIQGEYQKEVTKITALTAVLPFPDYYFNVFLDGLLWKAYQYSDDPRAGTLQHSKNGAVYTGQLGVFYNQLHDMILAEDWGTDANRFPTEPLGVSRFPGNPGLFSF